MLLRLIFKVTQTTEGLITTGSPALRKQTRGIVHPSGADTQASYET